MSLSLSDLIKAAERRLQLPVSSIFVANADTDGNLKLLKACADETMQNVRDSFWWPQLTKEWTFTLATNTAGYALPGDFNQMVFATQWNRTQKWPLIGPLNSQEWQLYKSGLVANFPRQRFMVRGWSATQFTIDPTPDSGLNGQTCVFEYTTNYTMRPSNVWTASTGITQRYIYYGLNIYDKGSVGAATTGTTAPTHTSGTVSDGLVNWTYVPQYDSCQVDTDFMLLDDNVILDGICWRFKRERGKEYQDARAEADAQLELVKTNLSSASPLTFNALQMRAPMIGPWSYPVQSI